MRVKLDENIPSSLRAGLSALGHDVDTVEEEGLKGHDDGDVWKAAQRDARFVVTADRGFGDTRAHPPGTHAGVLVVRLPMREQYRTGSFVLSWFALPGAETWGGCVVVGTPAKLRVVRPRAEDPPGLVVATVATKEDE